MKRVITYTFVMTLVAAFLISCVTSHRTYEGATAGAAFGAAAGALIDNQNRWRGSVIGGLLGAAFGGTVTEISTRAAREAAQTGSPVAYQSTDGWQRIQAEPVYYDYRKRCHKVRKRIWRNGVLIKDGIREVCEGGKTLKTY